MVPFAGYRMPVSYEGVNIEHQTVRESVGVFDVSHMGEFLVEGPRALDLIQKITSNDASKLEVGKAQVRTALCPAETGIQTGNGQQLVIFYGTDQIETLTSTPIGAPFTFLPYRDTLG